MKDIVFLCSWPERPGENSKESTDSHTVTKIADIIANIHHFIMPGIPGEYGLPYKEHKSVSVRVESLGSGLQHQSWIYRGRNEDFKHFLVLQF